MRLMGFNGFNSFLDLNIRQDGDREYCSCSVCVPLVKAG